MSNLECNKCMFQGYFPNGKCPQCGSTNLISDETFMEPIWDEEVFMSNEEIAKELSRD